MKGAVRTVPKAVLIGATLVFLQACAPPNASSGNSVVSAYETSGIVNIPPYTRTIFSTHNF